MDIKELRKELRDWKAEVEDRLQRLEAAQEAASAQEGASAAATPATSKKAAVDAPTGDTAA